MHKTWRFEVYFLVLQIILLVVHCKIFKERRHEKNWSALLYPLPGLKWS